jgi:hypothetical protein
LVAADNNSPAGMTGPAPRVRARASAAS